MRIIGLILAALFVDHSSSSGRSVSSAGGGYYREGYDYLGFPIRDVHRHHEVGHGTSSSTGAEVGPSWAFGVQKVIRDSTLFGVAISSPPDSALYVAMVMLMDCLPRATSSAQMPVAVKVQSGMSKKEDLNKLLNLMLTIESCKGIVEKHFYPYGRLTRD